MVGRKEGKIMSEKKILGAMVDAFRYSPGDGRVYRLAGDYSVITVYRIVIKRGWAVMEIPTGDTIPAPQDRTATALIAAVDAWRGVAS
jgi:hypothetical protein